jgi:hypothetical protein
MVARVSLSGITWTGPDQRGKSVTIGCDRGIPVIVDCAHYCDGLRQREERLDLEAAAEVCRRSDEPGFVWIALFEPDPAELAEVQDPSTPWSGRGTRTSVSSSNHSSVTSTTT